MPDLTSINAAVVQHLLPPVRVRLPNLQFSGYQMALDTAEYRATVHTPGPTSIYCNIYLSKTEVASMDLHQLFLLIAHQLDQAARSIAWHIAEDL